MKKNLPKPKQCCWPIKDGDTLMQEYHDIEWGVPLFDDQKIFEFLVLESAQAGLSWQVVLRKRENYRKAFAGFDPRRVAKFDAKKIAKLLQNSGIIRNRAKIAAAINNARVFLKVQKEFGTFSKYIWEFVGNKPIRNRWKTIKDLPAKTEIAEKLSDDLKARGFKFLGPTVIYAHMQATGMVNDHLVGCSRWRGV